MLVKMDDAGLALSRKDSAGLKKFGRGLVKAMPVILQIISVVGVFAMLWVGGHIMVVGTEELGWGLPYHLVHGVEQWAFNLGGGVLGWFGNTFGSLIFGLLWGAIITVIVTIVGKLIPRKTSH